MKKKPTKIIAKKKIKSKKPFRADGLIIIGIALFGGMTATFSSDAAYKYILPYPLFWAKQLSAWGLGCLIALKAYLSTEYADYKRDKERLS